MKYQYWSDIRICSAISVTAVNSPCYKYHIIICWLSHNLFQYSNHYQVYKIYADCCINIHSLDKLIRFYYPNSIIITAFNYTYTIQTADFGLFPFINTGANTIPPEAACDISDSLCSPPPQPYMTKAQLTTYYLSGTPQSDGPALLLRFVQESADWLCKLLDEMCEEVGLKWKNPGTKCEDKQM